MLTVKTTRIAYLVHAVLSALVIGLLAWATVASLRLESADRAAALARAQHDHERTIAFAVYQIELFAQATLSQEVYRPSADYAPLYLPGTDEIRVHSGEILQPGSLVRPSPLLLHPSNNPWILLHFQASPREGYRSPEIVPEQARHWADFSDGYDASERERFITTLAQLRYAYTVDELAHKYEEAGGVLTTGDTTAQQQLAQTAAQYQTAIASQPEPQSGKRSEYAQRKQSADLMNRAQTQNTECAPEKLAVAQLHEPSLMADAEESNANTLAGLDDEVGITYRTMLPVWIKLPNRPARDLAFLRAAHTTGESAFEGFVVDWPACRAALLAQVADRFPNARLETIDPPPTANDVNTDNTVLGMIPARFVPEVDPPMVAASDWSTTHTILLMGWIGSMILLLGGALSIRSLVALTDRRTQFAYAVTHELRTPLTTFRLYTDMLAQGLVSEENRQTYLETLNVESQRLADLVSGVLEYSRVENHSVPVSRERVTVGEVLESVRETCTTRCASADMGLDIDGGALADTATRTDRHHVVQIIGNLVDNACKYGRSEDDPVVHIRAQRADGSLHFDVIDHGRGVPQRLRSAIFKPYERGDMESVPATGGIGLGLALSRSWARLLGGHLELVPPGRDERGAHFRLTLPIRDE